MAQTEQKSEWDGSWLNAVAQSLERTIPAKLKKEFIAFMFEAGFWDPSKLSWEAAVTRMNDCLRADGEKRQFFKVSELLAWMRHSGEHDLLLAIAESLGYRVERIPSTARVTALLERIDQRIGDAEHAFADVRCLRDTLAGIGSDGEIPRARRADANGSKPRFCNESDF